MSGGEGARAGPLAAAARDPPPPPAARLCPRLPRIAGHHRAATEEPRRAPLGARRAPPGGARAPDARPPDARRRPDIRHVDHLALGTNRGTSVPCVRVAGSEERP